MSVPDSLHYTSDHEWISVDGDIATLGITHHAQEELSDVVFVELPEVGRSVSAGDAFAVVESVKAASDIYAPIAGEVTEVNSGAESDPSVINSDPYGGGWICKLKISDAGELDKLLDAAAYKALIGG